MGKSYKKFDSKPKRGSNKSSDLHDDTLNELNLKGLMSNRKGKLNVKYRRDWE